MTIVAGLAMALLLSLSKLGGAAAAAAHPLPVLIVTAGQWSAKDPAYLANGVIGLRVGPNPLVSGSTAGGPGSATGALVMGWYKRDEGGDDVGQYAPAPAPFPFTSSVVANNVSMQQHSELVHVTSQTLNTSSGELTSTMIFASANASLGVPFSCNITAMVYLSRKIPTLAGMEVDAECTPTSTTISITPNLVKPGSQWKPDPDPVIVDLPDLAHFTPVNRYSQASGDSTLEAAIGLRHAGKSQQPFSSLGVASTVLRRSSGAGQLSYYAATAMVRTTLVGLF